MNFKKTLIIGLTLLSSVSFAKDQTTALHFASEKGDIKYIDDLIKSWKLRAGQRDLQGNSAYHKAVIANNPEALKELIKMDGKNLDVQDNLGRTPLVLAIISGRYKLAEILIKDGASLKEKDDYMNDAEFYIGTLDDSNPLKKYIKAPSKVELKKEKLKEQQKSVDNLGNEDFLKLKRKNKELLKKIKKQEKKIFSVIKENEDFKREIELLKKENKRLKERVNTLKDSIASIKKEDKERVMKLFSGMFVQLGIKADHTNISSLEGYIAAIEKHIKDLEEKNKLETKEDNLYTEKLNGIPLDNRPAFATGYIEDKDNEKSIEDKENLTSDTHKSTSKEIKDNENPKVNKKELQEINLIDSYQNEIIGVSAFLLLVSGALIFIRRRKNQKEEELIENPIDNEIENMKEVLEVLNAESNENEGSNLKNNEDDVENEPTYELSDEDDAEDEPTYELSDEDDAEDEPTYELSDEDDVEEGHAYELSDEDNVVSDDTLNESPDKK